MPTTTTTTTDTCPGCGADVARQRPTDWPLHRYVCARCRDAARRGELAKPARYGPRHTSAGPHRADTSQTERQPCT